MQQPRRKTVPPKTSPDVPDSKIPASPFAGGRDSGPSRRKAEREARGRFVRQRDVTQMGQERGGIIPPRRSAVKSTIGWSGCVAEPAYASVSARTRLRNIVRRRDRVRGKSLTWRRDRLYRLSEVSRELAVLSSRSTAAISL